MKCTPGILKQNFENLGPIRTGLSPDLADHGSLVFTEHNKNIRKSSRFGKLGVVKTVQQITFAPKIENLL